MVRSQKVKSIEIPIETPKHYPAELRALIANTENLKLICFICKKYHSLAKNQKISKVRFKKICRNLIRKIIKNIYFDQKMERLLGY